MSDNKKYYYLKLKDNFFDSDSLIVLESMPDGHLYSNILLKLYLRSLKHEGRLVFNDKIPYNSTILAQVTRHSVGVVEKALSVFRDLELIEVLDNGAIYMLDIQNFIGTSSTEADRKREYRARIENEKQENGQMSRQLTGQTSDKSPPEIEIELDLEKEIKIETKTNTYTDRFNTFWEAYPKKIGKVASEKSFKKLKPSSELLNKMLETIEVFKKSDQWNKDGGQFIPNPATWLNQGRWDDEPGTNQEARSGDKKWGDPDYYAIPDDYEGL